MALINCPECRREVSNKAKNCIHCGFPLDSVEYNDKLAPTEKADKSPREVEATNVCTENISPKTENTKKNFNYKKIIIPCSIGILVIILLCVIFIKPSFEENLSGTWTSTKDSSSGKAMVTFSYENDIISGELSYYDYEESEWDKMSFKVEEYTEYTMTLLFDGGKIDKISYSLGNDKLIFDGVIYTNKDKNVKVDKTKRTYILDGVPMPIIEDVYLGMTESEFKGTDFYAENTASYSSEFLNLPDWYYPTVDGFVSYGFNKETGKLQNLTFFFYEDTTDKTQKLKTNIIDAYSSQFGNYTKRDWSTTKDYTDYIWRSGNLTITFCDQTREAGDVAYTIQYIAN